jgi:hypothetical protein
MKSLQSEDYRQAGFVDNLVNRQREMEVSNPYLRSKTCLKQSSKSFLHH